MIVVDANLLLYAANQAAPEHRPAREWLDSRLSGTARVGLPWPSLLAFVRLLCSTDGDFARFAGLDWQNPLAS